MWITSIQINLAELRALDVPAAVELHSTISNKKNELQNLDGHGGSMSGFEGFRNLTDVPSDVNSYLIKRVWNTESAAQEFMLFINNLNGAFTATIEEQI
jgi:hypothetical protein